MYKYTVYVLLWLPFSLKVHLVVILMLLPFMCVCACGFFYPFHRIPFTLDQHRMAQAQDWLFIENMEMRLIASYTQLYSSSYACTRFRLLCFLYLLHVFTAYGWLLHFRMFFFYLLRDSQLSISYVR